MLQWMSLFNPLEKTGSRSFLKKECQPQGQSVQVWNARAALHHGLSESWLANHAKAGYRWSHQKWWQNALKLEETCGLWVCPLSWYGLEMSDMQLVSRTLRNEKWWKVGKLHLAESSIEKWQVEKWQGSGSCGPDWHATQGMQPEQVWVSVCCDCKCKRPYCWWLLGLDFTLPESACNNGPERREKGALCETCKCLLSQRHQIHHASSTDLSASEEDSIAFKQKGTNCIPLPLLCWQNILPTNWNKCSLLQLQPLLPSMATAHARLQMQNSQVFNLNGAIGRWSQTLGQVASAAPLPRRLSRLKAKVSSKSSHVLARDGSGQSGTLQ